MWSPNRASRHGSVRGGGRGGPGLRSDRERLLDILEAIERIELQDIDTDLVWSVVKNDLPKLEAQIGSIIEGIR